MKKIIFICMLFAAFALANEDCIFGPPCPSPPTEAEILAVDKMFTKVRYALGAIYRAQIADAIENPPPYKNIDEYVDYVAELKRDISDLSAEADQLSNSAYAGFLKVAIREMIMCVGSYGASSFCDRALISLKDYMWNKTYEGSWSGYLFEESWDGFPDSMK